jgi:hypothetical protein
MPKTYFTTADPADRLPGARSYQKEEDMKAFRTIAAAVALGLAAIPAFAEGSAALAYVVIIRPDGMSTTGQITGAAAREVLAHSKQVGDPVVVIFAGGKAYLGDPGKMPDGSSMMDFISSSFCSDARHTGGCG